jgi:hypothetical protein
VEDKIRAFLPNGAKLAFVFDLPMENRSVVFYVNDYRVYEATFDGESLDHQAATPWANDGLSPYSDSYTDYWQMYKNQFRALTATDALLYEMFLDKPMKSRDNRIALGCDVVILSTSAQQHYHPDRGALFFRRDWDFGDRIIHLLKEYPVLLRDASPHTENIRTVLSNLSDLLGSAPKSKHAQKLVARTWETIQSNLEIAQYHPELAPLYNQVCQASKEYLLSSI